MKRPPVVELIVEVAFVDTSEVVGEEALNMRVGLVPEHLALK